MHRLAQRRSSLTHAMATQRADYDSMRGYDQRDAHDDLDAIAEASDSLMGRTLGEKGWDELMHVPRPRHSQWRRCWSSVSLQGLLNTLLLVLVLALLFDRRWSLERYGQQQVTGDITGFVPPVGQQIKSFVPDMGFAPENASEFFSNAVQDKWLSIVPSKPSPNFIVILTSPALTAAVAPRPQRA